MVWVPATGHRPPEYLNLAVTIGRYRVFRRNGALVYGASIGGYVQVNASKWLIHSGWESESFGDVNAGRLGMLFEVDSDLIERMASDEYLDQECLAVIIANGYTHIVAYSNEYGQTWYIGCVNYSQAWNEWRNFIEDWTDDIIAYERMMNG